MGMRSYEDEGRLVIELEGRIDSGNVAEVEREVDAIVGESGPSEVELDVSALEYISSAGLRMVMRLARRMEHVIISNASPEVYDVFEMTGFTQILDVRRSLREVSVDGLQMIGAGANGRVYRLDEERIIKVYNPVSNPPEKIRREREVSRKAFVQGIPSAISFELVRVGDCYGIIYEMIDARTLGEAIKAQPERLEEYAKRMAKLLKQLHATEFEEGELPDARLSLHAWADIAQKSGLYSDELIAAMRAAIDAIPVRNTFVHGDFHPANIMVTDDDELLLIDMGDASVGDPVVDLCGSCQIMLVMRVRPGAAELYTGLDEEALGRVWDIFIREYLGTDDDAEVAAVEQKLRFYAVIRSMAGISFSKVVPDDERAGLAGQVSALFLNGCERMGIV